MCDGFFGGETTYCRNDLAVLGMTSAIFLVQPEPFDPATTLVYDGPQSGNVGAKAIFSATLTGSDGPVAGAPVTFTYRARTFSATTDASGRASAATKVTGPPGSYELTATFDGSERYSPSRWAGTFTVTTP